MIYRLESNIRFFLAIWRLYALVNRCRNSIVDDAQVKDQFVMIVEMDEERERWRKERINFWRVCWRAASGPSHPAPQLRELVGDSPARTTVGLAANPQQAATSMSQTPLSREIFGSVFIHPTLPPSTTASHFHTPAPLLHYYDPPPACPVMIGDLSFSDQYTRWAARKRSQKCGGGSSRRVNQRQIIEPWKLSAPQSLASGLKIDALHDRFRIDQHSRSCFATGRFACGKKIMAESWSLWIWNLVATARQPSKPQSFAFHTRYHHHHNNNNKYCF